MEHLILEDNDYTGAKGEGESLIRPLKRCEKAYEEEPDCAKLKSWRALQGLFAWNAKRYSEIVKAISVLHN